MLQLLVRHGRTYESLAQTFQTTPEGVRERAQEAVDELVGSAPDPASRERLTDYLLGQLAADQVAGVREQLERSSPARAWTEALVGALDPLYPPGKRPALPGGADDGTSADAHPAEDATSTAPPAAIAAGHWTLEMPERAAAPGEDGVTPWRRADRSLTPLPPVITTARPARAKRRGAPWIALLLALLAGVVGVAALLLARAGEGTDRTRGSGPLRVERQAVMRPAAGAGGGGGIAVIGRWRGSPPRLLMQARLERPARGASHELWLYRSPRDARSLGVVRVDRRGNLRAAAPLPEDFASYRAIDLSRERDRDPRHSGRSLLRARLPGQL